MIAAGETHSSGRMTEKEFLPHWFAFIGMGAGFSRNVLNGLSKKNLHIPPHRDDFDKYDYVQSDTFRREDGAQIGQGTMFLDIGYKFTRFIGLKNRFAVSLFDGIRTYPPPIRLQYITGQNAYTYLVPTFGIADTIIADVSYTKYNRYFPAFAVGMELGLQAALRGYEYGWDRYAKRERGGDKFAGAVGIQVGAYIKLGALKIGVSLEGLITGAYMLYGYIGAGWPFGYKKQEE